MVRSSHCRQAGAKERMRDAPRGLVPVMDERRLVFDFEGASILAREGQSVAAALIEAGIRAWRIDEAGHHKGALCCIGYCFECRCRIDGESDRRACLTEAKPGMRVDRPRGLG
jgi:predicted molibdopterin-dependent oxidoreductase YjgC